MWFLREWKTSCFSSERTIYDSPGQSPGWNGELRSALKERLKWLCGASRESFKSPFQGCWSGGAVTQGFTLGYHKSALRA